LELVTFQVGGKRSREFLKYTANMEFGYWPEKGCEVRKGGF
jgi:hypothetical protein